VAASIGRLSAEVEKMRVIVAIICDRGDRYLSTGVYERKTMARISVDRCP